MTLQLPFKLQLKDFLQLTLLKFKKKEITQFCMGNVTLRLSQIF